MKSQPFHWLVPWLLLGLATPARAISLPEIFGDQMVLQRDQPLPIWGTARPLQPLEVRLGQQQHTATADTTGRWQVVFDPIPVQASPLQLEVRSTAGDDPPVTIRDILIGEVWLCSGQSNMAWPLGPIANARGQWPGVAHGEEEVAAADWPLLRLNGAADHEFGLAGWHPCTPATARGFSATAYFFGRELHQRLNVPVGLILRSLGGTTIQAWTPKAELEKLTLVRQSQQLLKTQRTTIQEWQRDFAAYRQQVKAKQPKRPQPPAVLPDDLETARKLQNLGSLHEKYIEPLVPFAIAGSIWYQGESNANPRSLARHYGDFLRALIDSRRRLWQAPNLPFYFVQLPVFDKQPTNAYWHLVREEMRRTSARTPETGMVVSYDVCDPSNLHPPEKQEVGRRLAWWALAQSYRQPIAYSGPLWRQARFADGIAILEFDHGEGLRASDSQPLRGFQLAGKDRQFKAASARIEGNSIILSSPLVPHPESARFFFGGVERPNLVNAAGLPASPFTTLEGDE